MKIKSLTLYKTQLDAEYFNVIDAGKETDLTKERLKTDVFDAFYSPFVVYNDSNNIKSVKSTDGVSVVVIDKTYEKIVNDNFNYVIIDDGSKLHFFFLVGVESLNDGSKPSCALTIKRDAWNENIEFFTNHQEKDVNQVVRSHFERFYDDGAARTFWPFYYNTNDIANITKFKDEQFLYTSSGNYVVWCWFRCSNDCKIGPVDGAVEIKSGYFGRSYFDASAPCYIFPVAVVTGFTDGVPNFSFNITFQGHSMNMGTLGNLMKAFNFNSDKFLEAGLTLFPPFAYSCSGTTITASNVVSTTASILNELNEVIYNPDDDFAQICYVIQSNASTAYTQLTYEYTNDLTGFSAGGTVGSKLWDVQASYEDVKMFEPRVFCTPYVDLNFICNNLSVPIDIVQDRTKFKAIVNIGGKSSPLVSCFLNDDIVASYQNMGTLGNLPTSSNKWESFLSKTVTNVGLSAITATISGALSGGAAGAAAGALGAIGSGAVSTVNNMVNIASRPNAVSQPSELASDNIPRSIPKIVSNRWKSERELEGVLGEMHAYGYRFQTTKSVKNNVRTWFDFCQTVDCNLSELTNYMDRKELENAFNTHGVTKWHFDNAFGLNAQFNKYQNNPERKYVSAEDAQLAFNFTGSRPYENKGTIGNVIVLDDRTGTYELTDKGVKFSEQTAGHISTTANIANYVQFAARANSSVVQLKISDFEENFSTTGVIATIHRDVANLIRNENGDLFLSYVSYGAYGPQALNVNISDVINKTLTFTYYFTGYGTGSSIDVYLDDVLLYSGGYGQYATAFIGQLGGNTNATNVAGVTIAKWRRYYTPGVTQKWTVDEVQKHLL